MFLIPAIVAAAGYELSEAFKHTEKISTNDRMSNLRSGEVQPNGSIVEVPDSSDAKDKQLVVFSEKPNNQQGLSVVGSEVEIPVTQQAIRAACKTLVSTFPFPTFGVAENLCISASNLLVKKGVELTKSSVTIIAEKMAGKIKNMSNKSKSELKREIRAITQQASRTSAPSMSRKAKVGSSAPSVGVSAPLATTQVIGRRGAPTTKTIKDGLSVTHSELITSIISAPAANTYKAQGFVINPGKGDVFPWLSTMATNYDKYRLVRMVVELVTFSPTTVKGRLGIAYDPDSTDALPYDRTEFYAMDKHMQGPVWQTIALELPCPKQELFINSHTTTDSKLIDAGQFVVMTDQLADASVSVADVIVHYTVNLLKPQQALYQTQYNDLAGVAHVKGFPVVNVNRGVNLFKTYFSDATTQILAPPVGCYMCTLIAYDGDTGSPTMTLGNYTGSDAFYWAPTGSTSIVGRVCIFKITTSPTVTPEGVSGQCFNFTLGTVAPANLEAIHVICNRISPSIYNYLSTINYGGFTKLSSS